MPRPSKGERTPGSGKPKGYKAPGTLAKEAAREYLRQRVTDELDPMLEAQIAHAKGVHYIVARHVKTGKFKKLTEELALRISEGDETEYEALEVWTKDPSVQAFTDLLNRALDKPKDQPLDVNLNHGLDQRLLDLLQKGRDRAHG
jgi:hypothetical protein